MPVARKQNGGCLTLTFVLTLTHSAPNTQQCLDQNNIVLSYSPEPTPRHIFLHTKN